MKLYHFTPRRSLSGILKHGIRPGYEPIEPKRVVWLDARGDQPPKSWPKSEDAVRLTVNVPKGERLVPYLTWCWKHLPIESLHQCRDIMRACKTHYIYFGTIPPDNIQSVVSIEDVQGHPKRKRHIQEQRI
jgi:hypothetical protein